MKKSPPIIHRTSSNIIFALLSFCLIAGSSFAEHFFCDIGTTGLTKNDIYIIYIDNKGNDYSASNDIIVSEFPSGSGIYKFDNLYIAIGTYYYIRISYNNQTKCEYRYPIGSACYETIAQCVNFQISQNNRIWYSGDTKPNLTLTVSNFPENPVGFICKFFSYDKKGNKKIEDNDCIIEYTLEDDGEYTLTLTYIWTATDLSTTDKLMECIAYFRLMKSNSIYTFPADNSLRYSVIGKQW